MENYTGHILLVIIGAVSSFTVKSVIDSHGYNIIENQILDINTSIVAIKNLLVRQEAVKDRVNKMESEIESLYERMRVCETALTVLENSRQEYK